MIYNILSFAKPKRKYEKKRAFAPQKNIHVFIAGGARPCAPGFSLI